MQTKQNFKEKKERNKKLDILLPDLFHFYSFFLPFLLLNKVKFLNKKWKVVGGPDFPLIFPVKSDRFFACKSNLIYKISLSHLSAF